MNAMTEQTYRPIILSKYTAVLKSCRNLISSEDIRLIRKAFKIAIQNETEASELNYQEIVRILDITLIITQEIGLGRTSIICAMLHKTVEKEMITLEQIREMFGEKVEQIIKGLKDISHIYATQRIVNSENFRKLLLSFAEDIRVQLIFLAEKLYALRQAAQLSEAGQKQLAMETSYIYIPFAHRLGLYNIKSEMEDTALRYANPQIYREIEQKLKESKTAREAYIAEFIAPIAEEMNRRSIKFKMKYRTKTIASILNKMRKSQVEFEEIFDIFAVRFIIDSVGENEKPDCWRVYSIVTDKYTPNPQRLRDWISVPKSNGYESLQTTVLGPGKRWVEVQIRTERMDEIAEKGLAAHWKYKNEGESSELDKWLAGIKEILDQPDASALEFLDEFKLNLFAKEIRVFTPKGYMRTLPKGATALDFAYDIHTEIGNTCIGAKVNHKLVPMSHKLTSGDQVEILTSDKQKPQREWLDFVVTAKARTHINATFKKYRKEQIRTGITIFEAVVKKLDLPPTSEPLKKVLTDYNLTNKDDLYVELAKNIITEGDLEKVLKKKAENKFIKYWKLQFLWNGKDGEEKKKNDNDVQLDVNSDFVIAPCCNPIPGDDVVGMNIAGTKVTVHKRSCPEAIRLMASFGDKIVPIKWVSHKLMSFLTVIKMTGIDKPGIVSDITALIAKEGKVNMRMIHFDTRDGIFEGFIHLYVHNTADLNNIVSRISQIQGVESVMRVENEER
mgnify:FL=1